MGTLLELSRRFRRIKPEIDEELRGWSWHEPPVLHAYPDTCLPISDVYSDVCRCGAYVYLKYVERRAVKLPLPLDGIAAHMLWTRFYSELQQVLPTSATPDDLYHALTSAEAHERQIFLSRILTRIKGEGVASQAEAVFDRWFRALWKPMTYHACAELARLQASPAGPEPESVVSWLCPIAVELRVDSTLVGFSGNCRVDGLAPFGLIVELKTGRPGDLHKLALTAYALAVESIYEVPIDYGLLLYLDTPPHKPISTTTYVLTPLDNKLRMDALSERDRISRVVAERQLENRHEPCGPLCPLQEVIHA